MLGLLAIAGCMSAPTPPPAAPPHFAGWDHLVDVVLRGDVAAARVIARDLTEGDAGGSVELGGALGVLAVAGPEDLADGLAAAAWACGACHRDIGFGPRAPSAAWSHPEGARLLVADAVAGRGGLAPPPADPLRAAWDVAPDAEARLQGVLASCDDCHERQAPGSDRIR